MAISRGDSFSRDDRPGEWRKFTTECMSCQKLVQIEVTADVVDGFALCDRCDEQIIFTCKDTTGSFYVTKWETKKRGNGKNAN